MRKMFIILLAVFVVLSLTTMTFAAPAKGVDTKLGRGCKNVVLGWTEIPKNVVDTTKKEGAIVGLTVGTIKGVLQACARTISGAVDIVTFPIGSYDKPAIKPSMIEETAASARGSSAVK